MRRRACAAFAAVVVSAGCALIFAGAGPAAAATGVEVDVGNTGSYTASPTQPLINVNNMVPGSTVSGELGVWNTTGSSGSITLKFQSAVVVPSGAGRLDSALLFTLATAPVGVSPTVYTQIWSGSAVDLETGVQVLAALAGDSKELVQLSATLPLATGNSVQGNSFTFGIAVVLAGPGSGGPIIPSAPSSSSSTSPSAGVGGVSTHKTGPGGGSTATIPPAHGNGDHGQTHGGGSLATTGIDIVLLALIGILLTLCGVLILLRSRTARRAL